MFVGVMFVGTMFVGVMFMDVLLIRKSRFKHNKLLMDVIC